MVGCVASLYKSAETLDETYIASNQNKTRLLNPISKNTLFLTGTSSTPTPTTGRKLNRCCRCASFTDVYGARCSCGYQMITTEAKGEGIVKGVVTYTVMDDLTVMPTSVISRKTDYSQLDCKVFGIQEYV